MANLIVISSIIFPCMYVSLFVRDESERSVKNQASKGESVEFMTSLQVASKKQSARRPRIEHMIRSWGVMPAISPSKKFMRYRCSLFTLSSPTKKAIGRDGRQNCHWWESNKKPESNSNTRYDDRKGVR